MKYNVRYRKSSTVNLAPVAIDPSPMSREGTRALVERFYAMRRDGQPEVGAGGRPAVAVSTSPIPPGPKKTKSFIAGGGSVSSETHNLVKAGSTPALQQPFEIL